MVACFHKIGMPNEDHTVNSLEQILNHKGSITFDGAYKSVWHFRHALKDRKPILFVQGATVGTEGVCEWWQIMEMVYRLGFELGWHGRSHHRLTELSRGDIYQELRPGGPLLAEEYKYYAYPHGDFDQKAIDLVRQAGYERAYSTTQGEEGNDFAIPREYV